MVLRLVKSCLFCDFAVELFLSEGSWLEALLPSSSRLGPYGWLAESDASSSARTALLLYLLSSPPAFEFIVLLAFDSLTASLSSSGMIGCRLME